MPVQTSDDESFFAERYLSNESLPAVEPDLLVIEAAAQAGEAGEGMVRNFHEHLVGELFGNRIGWLTAHAKDLDRRIEFQEAQLSRLEKQMDAESLECETKPDGPSVPWTWPEIFGLFLKGATVAVFAYLELNAIGIMGLAGEIPKVDTLPKAIKFFGAAAIALPWSVKLLGHFALGNEFQRHFYFILSWAAALLIVFWAFVMSEVFGGFLIISLDPDIPLFPKWILIAAQTIGCGLIAGLLSISMCHTFEKHRGFKVVPRSSRRYRWTANAWV
jgi:hypothetical protein